MTVISALGRLRHEDPQFEASQGYTVRPCLEPKAGEEEKKKNLYNYCH
jgi:hypothetical protein